MLTLCLLSGGLLFVALALHVLLGRMKQPSKQTERLLKIFAATMVVGGVITLMLFWDQGMMSPELRLLQFLLCFSLITLSYSSAYSLIVGNSPSIMIVMAVRARGEEGLSNAEAMEMLHRENVLGQRLKELRLDRLIIRTSTGFRLTEKGLFWARIFNLGRRILGLPVGG